MRRALGGIALVSALLFAGCGLNGQSGSKQLDALRQASVPYFYLGDAFEGLPVTHAEGNGRGGFVVYGDCAPRGGGIDPGGCAPPVEVQTKTCGGRKAEVAIFFGQGSDKFAAGGVQRAKAAVRPLTAAAKRIPMPVPSYDSMPPCSE